MHFRFKAGLNCLGLLNEVRNCQRGFEEVFFYQTSITAALLIDDIFAIVERSETGSNAWIAECDVITYWRDYVCDIEGIG